MPSTKSPFRVSPVGGAMANRLLRGVSAASLAAVCLTMAPVAVSAQDRTYADGEDYAGALSAPATLTVNGGESAVQSGVISGVASVIKDGNGALSLTADNVFAGPLVIQSGTLSVGNGGAGGSVNADIENYGTLVFDRSDNATYSGYIYGTGVLEKRGDGTLTLDTPSNYYGSTFVLGGTLALAGTANLLDSAKVDVCSCAVFDVSGVTSGTTSIRSLVNGGTVELGDVDLRILHTGPVDLFWGQIHGTGSVTIGGTGRAIFAGTNDYTGGTFILPDAELQIGYGNGSGSIVGDVQNDGTLSFDRPDDIDFGGAISGSGTLVQFGDGAVTLTGANSYTGETRVESGALFVNGNQSAATGAVTVADGAILGGSGIIGGSVTLASGATLMPGGADEAVGTLTILGNYASSGATLDIDIAPTGADQLVVRGSTSGTTQVIVHNRGGLLSAPVEGVKIVDVGGASNGVFTLNADYLVDGVPTVVAGAYGFRLYKNGIATPADGDWYLRSSYVAPGAVGSAAEAALPLYQPGVPVYEAYPAAMLALNGLPTLQQRVGNRSWAAGASPAGGGVWGRIEGVRNRANPRTSSALADVNIDSWKMQTGIDHVLLDSADGTLVGGVTGHYGKVDAKIASPFGGGKIDLDGYGVGGTLTWYGAKGFYVDAQGQYSWYKGDLRSSVLGDLVRNNDGTGEAFSLEVGKRAAIGGGLSVTPQVQVIYSNVRFDDFVDPVEAEVSASKGDSLRTRWGLSIDSQTVSGTASSHVYGLVNLSYEWLDGSVVDVSGAPIARANQRLWGELGLGATQNWKQNVALYGEVSATSPIRDFGDYFALKGTVGIRLRF